MEKHRDRLTGEPFNHSMNTRHSGWVSTTVFAVCSRAVDRCRGLSMKSRPDTEQRHMQHRRLLCARAREIRDD